MPLTLRTLRPMDTLSERRGPLEPLTAAQRAGNRAIIAAHYARERVIRAIRELPALVEAGLPASASQADRALQHGDVDSDDDLKAQHRQQAPR